MHPIELPPRRAQDAAREAERTEPGTWREIIARFERELGPLTDAEETAAAADDQPSGVAAVVAADGTATAEPGVGVTDGKSAMDEGAAHERSSADVADEAPDDERSTDERVLPGEPTYFDEPMPWEVAAMTTPGYLPPPSIHDAQHDGWPVDAEDGDTVPAWSDESGDDAGSDASRDADSYDDIGELLLEEEVPTDPWDIEPEPDEPGSRSDFPLDAFIVPAGVHHLPAGYDAAVAQKVAHRLDEMARRLRDGGLATLGSTDSVDELSRVLAAIVTGYVAHAD